MSKHQQQEEAGAPGPVRDGEFHRIAGIGPGIEKRLHAAGIHTFEQFAVLAPDRIYELLRGMVGVKPEIIVRKDWLGQARLLASQVALAEDAQQETSEEQIAQEAAGEIFPAGPVERQHYSSFLVELLLDEEKNVRRTRINDIQTGEQDSWAGWEPGRLEPWIADRAELRKAVDSTTLTREPALDVPQPVKEEQLPVRGSLAIKDVKTFSPGETDDSRSFALGEPVQMRVELDLSQVQVESSCPLEFRATVIARRMGMQDRYQQGQAAGVVQTGEIAAILIPVENLPSGLFRLDTLVSVYQADDPASSLLKAISEGKMVHVLSTAQLAR